MFNSAMNTTQRANKLNCMLRNIEDEADLEIADRQWENARELYVEHVVSLMDKLSLPRSKQEADAFIELVCSTYKAGYCAHHGLQTARG